MADSHGAERPREAPKGSGDQPTGPAVVWIVAGIVVAFAAVALFFVR